MPQGRRITNVGSKKPVEIALNLHWEVLELLDRESWRYDLERLEFVRLLLRRRAGRVVAERAADAPAARPIVGKKPRKHRMPITLGPDLLGILLEITNRLGNASKSTVVTHLILDWSGVSPLRRDHTVRSGRRSAPPKRSGDTGRPITGNSYTVVVPLAEQVLRRLEIEADRAGTSRGQLLRDIVSDRMGTGGVVRAPDAPRARPLANARHDKQSYSVSLKSPQVRFLDAVAQRMGGGEKATIVSHFILDWMEISPLDPTFALASARPRGRRGRRRR